MGKGYFYEMCSPEVIKRTKQEDEQTLGKMYPDQDWRNKYVLFVQFDLYWPYAYNSIQAYIGVTMGKVFEEPTGDALWDNMHGSYYVPPHIIRKPYPNKRIHSVCMKNGKRVSNLGIPVLFDTSEELREVCEVTCRWKIRSDDVDYDCHVIQHISFAENADENRRIYGVGTKERPLMEMAEDNFSMNTAFKQLQDYDAVGTIHINDGGNVYHVRSICALTTGGWERCRDLGCKKSEPGTYDVYWGEYGEEIPSVCVTRPGVLYVYERFQGHDVLEASDCSNMILHI